MQSKNLKITVIFFILLIMAVTTGLAIEPATPVHSGVPIQKVLNHDGTLNLDSGIEGSVNVDGWIMRVNKLGVPRFVKKIH